MSSLRPSICKAAFLAAAVLAALPARAADSLLWSTNNNTVTR